MATIAIKGTKTKTCGELPKVGAKAPDGSLTRADLSDVTLSSYPGKKVLNIFPSIDTPTCAMSVRQFNKQAGSRRGVVVLNISADLPFAQKRFCAAEGLEGVETLSAFRSTFLRDYGLEIAEGALRGLSARAVFVLDEKNKIVHCELVSELTEEPNYEAALASL